MRHWLMGLVAAAALLGLAQPAAAQGGMSPPGYPLSPWFGLFNRRGAVLDNYNSYVRPHMEAQKYMAGQTAAIRANANALGNLQRQVAQGERGDELPATGTASVFMNYSHYYSMNGSGGGGAPQASAARRTLPVASAYRGASGLSSSYGRPSIGSYGRPSIPSVR